jgi:methionyl aminopeptidase
MQTVHTVIKHGAVFWDDELVPAVLLQSRLENVQAAIHAAGDAAWLIYGDAQRCGALAYVSHYFPRIRDAAVLVTLDTPPIVFVNGGARTLPSIRPVTWIADVRMFANMSKKLAEALNEQGLANARVGTVGVIEAFPAREWNALSSSVPAVTFLPRDAEFELSRRNKDAAEIAVAQRAAHALETAFAVAATVLRPGASTSEAFALIERSMRLAGAEDVRILTSGGPDNNELTPPFERRLEDGDAIMLFLGVEIQRYWSEAAQTFVIGTPNTQAEHLASRARAAVDAMVATAIAGARGSVIAAAARKSLDDDALMAFAGSYGLGHGIGMNVNEGPSIALDSDDVLNAGTALALHIVLRDGPACAIAGRTIVTPGS